MEPRALIGKVHTAVAALELLATVPIWTVRGPGPLREARLAPALGPALPPEPYGYDDYDPAFFDAFEGADLRSIAEAIDASFDTLIMLPPDTPGLGTEADDARVVTVRLGVPVTVGPDFFLWFSRRAAHAPGQWIEERYWARIDPHGSPILSHARFGLLRPWSRAVWRRE